MSTTNSLEANPTAAEQLRKKVRAKGEEERKKRHEIVRLQADPTVNNHQEDGPLKVPNHDSKTAKKRSSFAFESRLVNAPKRPRRKPAARRRSFQSPSHDVDDDGDEGKLIDTKTPDISHLLPQIDDSGDRDFFSSVVRIHGLPVQAQKSDIRRFFSGLEVELVFVLPTNRVHILGWDSEYSPSNNGHLERHPNTFRVFCKFSGGAPVAALATQRSGEVLYIGGSTGGHGNKHREGATIALTQITKATARYLERNMAVDCEPCVPLHNVLTDVEETLDEIVPRILWSAAIQNLHLSIKSETRNLLENVRYEPLFHEIDSLDPSDPKGYSRLVQLHNTLLKDRDRLVNKIPFPAVLFCDSPELSRDVAIFLTGKASHCLLNTAQRIDQYLRMARAIQRQRASGRNVFARVTAG